MRISSLYHMTHSKMDVCPVCGKTYPRTDDWSYRSRRSNAVYYCSWHCLREEEKKREAQPVVKPEKTPKERVLSSPRYITPAEREDILKLYGDGLGAKRISKITGRSVHAIQDLIRKHYGGYRTPGKEGAA